MLRSTLATLALTSACAFTPAGDGAAPTDAPADDAALATDARPIDAPAIDAAIDARPIDAPPPCPGDYVGGYRLITTAQSWRAAEADCEDDTAGLSHLVVIDNVGELATVNAALAALAAGDVWVGVMRDAPTPWVWRVVTGGNASYLPWETGQPDNQSNDQQVVTLIRASGLLRDVSTGSSTDRAALCECDRRPPVDADYRP
ncbi:MAG: C-type lectin domain-containing protein [Myxococcales bacterium]|nr:C-type lectin domain-containing protein [Myxococcales bacterium]